jgi:hypothetical protein
MSLTSIQWIALIFTLLGLFKLIFLAFNKKKWITFVTPLYNNRKLSSIILILLATLVFYLLIKTLSIVQIMAVIAFTSLLLGFAAMQYSKEILALGKIITGKKFGLGIKLYIIIWITLSLWVLIKVFS